MATRHSRTYLRLLVFPVPQPTFAFSITRHYIHKPYTKTQLGSIAGWTSCATTLTTKINITRRRQHYHGFIAFATLMLLLACGSLFKIYTLPVRDARKEPHDAQTKAGVIFRSFDLDLSLSQPSSNGYRASTLLRRKRQVGSSKAFNRALSTGQKILASIDGAGSSKPRPSFEKVSDLRDWGWTSTQMDKAAIKRKLGNFVQAFEAKGIGVGKESMRGFTLTHARETVQGGVRYPVSGCCDLEKLVVARTRSLPSISLLLLRINSASP